MVPIPVNGQSREETTFRGQAFRRMSTPYMAPCPTKHFHGAALAHALLDWTKTVFLRPTIINLAGKSQATFVHFN
jgi:hypothetical protein